jgi:hypothetical protein
MNWWIGKVLALPAKPGILGWVVGFAGCAGTGVLGMGVDGTIFFNGWKTTALLQAGVEGWVVGLANVLF